MGFLSLLILFICILFCDYLNYVDLYEDIYRKYCIKYE